MQNQRRQSNVVQPPTGPAVQHAAPYWHVAVIHVQRFAIQAPVRPAASPAHSRVPAAKWRSREPARLPSGNVVQNVERS